MIELIIDKRIRDLAGGVNVGRLLPFRKRRMVGPFIFFDHIGPVDFAPGIPRELDVRPHPHIGLSTITYLYDGAITHRDSLGYEQEIRPGEVNWMIAGSGITHSERFDYARKHGAHIHGIQAWVALPVGNEEDAPSFDHHEGAELPAWSEGGAFCRLIAGEAEGFRAKARTHSPLFYVHWDMAAGSARRLASEYSQRAVYVAAGEIEIDHSRLTAGQMAVLAPAHEPTITALSPSIVMALGGETIGERFLFWNFVSSSKDRLEQAKEDWRQKRMKLPDADNLEFVPLPEDNSRAQTPKETKR